MIYFIIVFISFLLEGLVSNLVPLNSLLFQNCFTLMSLLVLYPYFFHKNNIYYALAFVAGVFLDVTYMNTIFLQGLLFLSIAFLIQYLNAYISSHALNLVFLSIIIVIFYRTISYFILIVIGVKTFSFLTYAQSITSSLLLNIAYTLVLYYLMEFLKNKFNLTKVD